MAPGCDIGHHEITTASVEKTDNARGRRERREASLLLRAPAASRDRRPRPTDYFFVTFAAFAAFGRLAGFAALAFRARVVGAAVLRVARSFKLVVRLARPLALRVDLREGFAVPLSSSAAPPFFATRLEALRAAVDLPPALRSVALTPGLDVSTGSSRRGRGARFGLGGFAPRCVFARERSALVLMRRD